MSNFRVLDQDEWTLSWGWYKQRNKENRIQLRIKQYVEYQGNHEYVIDDVAVFVFCDFDDRWWIGANYMDERNKFNLIGPYDNHEDALTFMLLQATVDNV